jgi:thiamine biosynthesis lipoprotein
MKRAFFETGGSFNPTLLPLQLAAKDSGSLTIHANQVTPSVALSDMSQVVVSNSTVAVPAGVALDAGGIGKGLAADLAVDHLLKSGFSSASVSIGGDVSVGHRESTPVNWGVSVVHPVGHVDTLSVASGGVATSTRVSRRSLGHSSHHYTLQGASESDVSSVTVVSSSAAWSDVWCKHAMVTNHHSMLEAADRFSMACKMVLCSGVEIQSDSWSGFVL